MIKIGPLIPTLWAFCSFFMLSVPAWSVNENINTTSNDALNCTIRLTASPDGVYCGKTTGAIDMKITGGTPPYKIKWGNKNRSVWAEISTSSKTYTIPDLPRGIYKIKIKDVNGCRDEVEVMMDDNASDLTYTIESSDPCVASGSMIIRIAGSEAPYWVILDGPTSGGIIANTDAFRIDNLLSGAYKITVDKDGCGHDQTTEIITMPTALGISITQMDNNLCDKFGDVKINITGGTSEYFISWHGATSGNIRASESKIIQNLVPGDYTFTVRDANFCTSSAKVTVQFEGQGSDLECVLTQTPIVCDKLGQIGVAINGGEPTYRIDYKGPRTGSIRGTTTGAKTGTGTILDLPAGYYRISVTDGLGCTTTESITVGGQVTDLGCVLTQTPVLCDKLGQIGVTINGGEPTYSINYSGPRTGLIIGTTTGEKAGTASILDLPIGDYRIVVTDSRGCTATESIRVDGQFSDLKCVLTQTPVLCDNMGQIGVTIEGGKPSYRIDYTGPRTGSLIATTTGGKTGTGNIVDLPAGDYTVVVVDSGGCSVTAVIVVGDDGSNLSSEVLVQPQICETNAGVYVTINGGEPGHVIAYSGAAAGSIVASEGTTFIPLLYGDYNIVVVDGNGCAVSKSVTVSAGTSDLDCRLEITPKICHKPGIIEVIISGGEPGFTVSWTTANNRGNTIFNAGYNYTFAVPSPGIYDIIVTDANGCVVMKSTEIKRVENNLAYQLFANAGEEEGNGSIEVYFQEGRSPYTVDLNGPVREIQITNDSIVVSRLPSGLYTVNITDANGCFKQKFIEVPVVGASDGLDEEGMRIKKDNPLIKLDELEDGQIKPEDSEEVMPLIYETQIPANEFVVYQNFPNPFKLSTTISFNLPESMKATIRIHNHLGKTITTVENDFAKGYNQYEFSHIDLGVGAYYYTVSAGAFSKTIRMLYLE